LRRTLAAPAALSALAFSVLVARPVRLVAAPGSGPGDTAGPGPTGEDSAAGTPAPPRLPGLAGRPLPAPDAIRPPADPTQRRAWLKAVLDEVFTAPTLSKAKIGVLVIEADGGRQIYARGEKVGLNAASNVKVITSAAALALLGPEYRWKTTLSAIAGPKGTGLGVGGEIPGDIFLKGFGDPTLGTQNLGAMAADLSAAGVRRIRGAIVADESFFDGTHVGPAYDQKTDSTVSRAPSAALSLNGNVVDITVVPGAKAGAPARVLIDPPSAAMSVVGHIVTATDGPALATVDTKDDVGGRTQVVVSGRARLGSEPRTYHRRVSNPPLYAAYTLKALLERRGITVAQPPRVAASPGQGLKILSTVDSPPLGVVVHDLNKRSNNFAAEQVLRTLGAEIVGRPGTWDKGLEAVGRYLTTLGIRKGTYQMTNGSGLYDSNRFSPEQIVGVLRGAMRDFRIAAEFMASLAVAGSDGTIGHRMANTPAERFVRAKTGTLATTSCLSGFAGAPGHPPLIFSILMNDVVATADARHAQDRAAELLVSYIEAETAAKP
jgi:D-alanyl-D-alanine carboxypeptidase/D-alanyl-D-alanine-endopeptidase (penicillin-binding protein 4)